MKDTTLGSEIEDSSTSDKDVALDSSTNSEEQEPSNDSVVDNDQVKLTVMKEEEEKKEENEEEEEKQKENEEPWVNNGNMLNNGAVIDSKYEIEDHMKMNENGGDKNNNDSIEMNPPGWDKDYEIRINLLRQEINETEEKHELWQNGINNRKEEALKRWEMIKKKHQDRLKAQRRLHAVMDSVLSKDDEEAMKEEGYEDM